MSLSVRERQELAQSWVFIITAANRKVGLFPKGGFFYVGWSQYEPWLQNSKIPWGVEVVFGGKIGRGKFERLAPSSAASYCTVVLINSLPNVNSLRGFFFLFFLLFFFFLAKVQHSLLSLGFGPQRSEHDRAKKRHPRFVSFSEYQGSRCIHFWWKGTLVADIFSLTQVQVCVWGFDIEATSFVTFGEGSR